MLAQHHSPPFGAPPQNANEALAAFFANPSQFMQDAFTAALANWHPPVDESAFAAADPDELHDVAAAAALLGVVPQTIHDYVKREVLFPHRLRPGGKLYFYKRELLAALKRNTREDGQRKYARCTNTKKA